MPRPDDRHAGVPRQVSPLYSMVPAGYPGHIDAFETAYGRVPNLGEGEADARRRPEEAVSGRDLVDADALRRRLGRRVRGDQAWAREERRLQGDAEVVRVGPVQRRRSGRSTTSSSSAGSRTTWTPRTTSCPSTAPTRSPQNGYKSPKMEALIRKELGAAELSQRLGYIRQIQVLAPRTHRSSPTGRAGDGCGRPERRARDHEHARREHLHAVQASCRSRRLVGGGVDRAPPPRQIVR